MSGTVSEIKRLLVTNQDHPYVTANVVVRGGALSDPSDRAGEAYMAMSMLMRGTSNRTQAAIAEDVDLLGSILDVSVGQEATVLRADASKRNLPRLLSIMADVVTNATWDADEFEKLRRQTLAELRNLRNHDEALVRHYFHQLLYDGHPYGRPAKGTESSLAKLTRDDVAAFGRSLLVRDNMTAACSGDLTDDEMQSLFAEHFVDVPCGEKALEEFPDLAPPQGRTLLLIDKPERTQTQVALGHLCVDARHPDYLPLLVGNTVFGGTFTARLSNEIREKRGWSYGAYSYFSAAARTGSFYARFYPNNEDTIPALELALKMFEDLAADGITEDECAFAKSFLVNQFPFRIDTAPKRLEQYMWAQLVGWPDDFLDTYVERLSAVTREQVNAALNRHVRPQDMLIGVLCTADGLRDELEALPGIRQTILQPYDKEWQPLAPGEAPRR